jgi:predicted RecA/RadA family phage recombinase
MKNFLQSGDVLTLTAPAVTGCKSGDLIIVGAIAGVAAYDALPVLRSKSASEVFMNCRRRPARSTREPL